MVDLDKILEKLHKFELPTEQELQELCDKAREMLDKLDNIAILGCPITVCGDIHGQFEDLLELFEVGGEVPETNYVFLGDLVDRGHNCIETFVLLLTLKLKYPDHITILRGNHESRMTTQIYGFYHECQRKYGSANVWRMFTDLFDFLQIAAVIDNKVFCVHGGLSPEINSIDEIRTIDRKKEIPLKGPMADLLWSDPDSEVETFSISQRGVGYLFGEKDVDKFNQVNNIELIARAHQLIQEGYQFLFHQKLVTVWSVPNYCYRAGNVASIMEFDEHMNRSFKIFEACPEYKRNTSLKKLIPEYFL